MLDKLAADNGLNNRQGKLSRLAVLLSCTLARSVQNIAKIPVSDCGPRAARVKQVAPGVDQE